MSQFTILIDEVVNEFETLVWKYANSIEGEGNDKAVHNIKSNQADVDIDTLLAENNLYKLLNEVLSIMSDFSPTFAITTNTITVTFTTRNRWAGRDVTLASLVKTYILDGMMVDWLNVTAPSEAAIYVARLPQDKENIIVELYKKKAPV